MATEISNGKQTGNLYGSVNRGKEMYQLAFYQAGRRVQKNFSDKAEAKRVAKQILGELTNDAVAVESMATAELESLVAAILHDPARVALEAGNSPQVIFGHY